MCYIAYIEEHYESKQMAVNRQAMFSDVKLNRELDNLSVVSKEQDRRSVAEDDLAIKLTNILDGTTSAKASKSGMFAQKLNITAEMLQTARSSLKPTH